VNKARSSATAAIARDNGDDAAQGILVTNFGTNRKPVLNFLLGNNTTVRLLAPFSSIADY